MHPTLLIHICSAVVGLISGYLVMVVRKGGGLHRAGGVVFVISMLIMSSSAAYVATFVRPSRMNVVVGLLTFYLVSTAWLVTKRRDGVPRRAEFIGMLYIAAVGLAGWKFGIEATARPRGILDGMPAPGYFVFGSIALLCAFSDFRMFRRGGVFGSQRTVRHLWRMTVALLIATLSFFPGQARQLPDALRESSAMFIPHIFLVGSMIYWRYRYRVRKRKEDAQPLVGATAPASS